MPNPADLPPEIFTLILSHALDEDVETQKLLSLSRLSRGWYASLIPRIYSSWTYNGASEPFITLYKFLLTVLRDQQLAAEVQTLRLGNWGFYPIAAAPAPELQFPDDEIELVCGAVRRAGIAHLEEEILVSLKRRDRRPLVALLLVSLPKLRRVWAHIPRRDPVLGAVLKKVINPGHPEPSSALAELSELYICQEPPVLPPWADSDSEDENEVSTPESWDSLQLNYIWPAFYHKPLRTLSLLYLDTKNASTWLPASEDRAPNKLSRLEHLHIVAIWNSVCAYADMHALISQPTALKSFTLSIRDNPYSHRRNEIISNAELWNCLLQHQETLESLDVCRSKGMHRDMNGRFGLIRSSFQKLKHLAAQIEILLGGCCGEPKAPFRLKDTVPTSIESLTLYGDEGFTVHTDLAAQLKEMVTGSRGDSTFPHLTSIVLDDSYVLYTDDGINIRPAYQDLVTVCKARGVKLRIEETFNSIGSLNRYHQLWGEVLYMQEDGEARHSAASETRKRLRDPVELILKDDGVYGEEMRQLHNNGNDRFTSSSLPADDPAIIHTIPFSDHRGDTAYMIFKNAASIPLPPLFCFAIYFTDPFTTTVPESASMQSLYEVLHPSQNDLGYIRYDMYFLPGATPEDCVAHYNTEKKIRGSPKDQIRVFETLPLGEDHQHHSQASADQTQKQLRIPGMVKKYPCLDDDYRSVLFISTRPASALSSSSWNDGAGLLCVEFDRKQTSNKLQLPQLNESVIVPDLEQDVHFTSTDAHMSGNTLPPIRITRCPLNQEDPSYDFTRREGPHPISDTIYDVAHVVSNTYAGPWVEAGKKGWICWR
ncbi:hypothetical protein BJX66DRAFT_21548 [Aspergillus keveii]|uniref:F-box domain-containing protein n=1 Tax=Aspergillus keveii TaxID=714993 RepID=A0ABR4FU92_9EURO